MQLTLEHAKQALQAQPFSKLVGTEIVAFSPAHSELRIPITDSLRQQHGFVHGGVLAYAADNALTFAGGAALGPAVVTSEFKINYLRPGQGEALVVRANVVYAGKSQAVCRCEVYSVTAEGEVVGVVAFLILRSSHMVSHHLRTYAVVSLMMLLLGSMFVAGCGPNALISSVEWKDEVGGTLSYAPKQGTRFLVVDMNLPAGDMNVVQDVVVINESGARFAAVGILFPDIGEAMMGNSQTKLGKDQILRIVFDIPDSGLIRPLKLQYKGGEPVPLTLPK